MTNENKQDTDQWSSAEVAEWFLDVSTDAVTQDLVQGAAHSVAFFFTDGRGLLFEQDKVTVLGVLHPKDAELIGIWEAYCTNGVRGALEIAGFLGEAEPVFADKPLACQYTPQLNCELLRIVEDPTPETLDAVAIKPLRHQAVKAAQAKAQGLHE